MGSLPDRIMAASLPDQDRGSCDLIVCLQSFSLPLACGVRGEFSHTIPKAAKQFGIAAPALDLRSMWKRPPLGQSVWAPSVARSCSGTASRGYHNPPSTPPLGELSELISTQNHHPLLMWPPKKFSTTQRKATTSSTRGTL